MHPPAHENRTLQEDNLRFAVRPNAGIVQALPEFVDQGFGLGIVGNELGTHQQWRDDFEQILRGCVAL